jgi:hypothetical protein
VRARPSRLTDFLLLATAFCVTFERVFWNVAGSVALADVLTILFLISFAASGRGRATRTVAAVLIFFGAFLLVYLLSFFNLETKQALDQYTKGMVKFVLHFVFLAAAVAYLGRRGERFYWRTLTAFTLGMVANGVYGILQLLAARAGLNLDHLVLSPLTGGANSINVYGAVNGASVYRPNALTGDPNHLGIMLVVPLLSLLPVYLQLERGNRLRKPLALTLAPSCSWSRSRRFRGAASSGSRSACWCSRCPTGASSGHARSSPGSPVSRCCSRRSSTSGATSSRSSSGRVCRRGAARPRCTSPSTSSSRRSSTHTRCSGSG